MAPGAGSGHLGRPRPGQLPDGHGEWSQEVIGLRYEARSVPPSPGRQPSMSLRARRTAVSRFTHVWAVPSASTRSLASIASSMHDPHRCEGELMLVGVEALGVDLVAHVARVVRRLHPEERPGFPRPSVLGSPDDHVPNPCDEPAALLGDLAGEGLVRGLPRLDPAAGELVVAGDSRVHHQQQVATTDHGAYCRPSHDPARVGRDRIVVDPNEERPLAATGNGLHAGQSR